MAWNVFFVFIFSVCVAKSLEGYQPLRGSSVWGYFTPPMLQRVPPVPQQTAMEAMVELTNNLGVAILQDHSFSRGNFAFSPYGVASVLVVLYEGARSESARQIHRAVKFPQDKDIIRVGFRDIHRHLRSYFSHEGYLSGISLNKQSSTLKEEYKRILKFYGYDVDLSPSLDDEDVGSGHNVSQGPPMEASINKTTVSPIQTPVTEVSISDKNATDVSEKEDANTTTQSVYTTIQPPPSEYPLNSTTMQQPVETKVTPPATEANLAQNLTESFEVETKETSKPYINETESVTTAISKPTVISSTITTTKTTSATPTTTKTTPQPPRTTTATPTTTKTTPKPPRTTTKTTAATPTTTTITQSPITTTTTPQPPITTTTTTPPPPITTTTTQSPITTTTTQSPITTTTTETTTVTPTTTPTPETTTETPATIPTAASTIIPGETTTTTTQDPQDGATTEIEDEDEFQINITVENRMNNEENRSAWNLTKKEIAELETIFESENITKDDLKEIANSSFDNGMLIPQLGGNDTTSDDLNEALVENIKDLINSRASLWLDEKPKKRRSRTITDYLKSPHNLDLSLQLQNGMYDTHVSRNADLYRKLPRLLFLVDGAVDTPVPMMIHTNIFFYAYIPRLHSKALEFPLDDIRYKLLIILPVERRGLRQLIYDLADYPLSNVLESVRPARVKATVPTFMVEGFVILTSSLQKLGIWDVFDPRKANLSGMSTDPELYVRNVEQSVTVVIRNYVEILDIQTRTMAARQMEYEFEATHPFLYFVLDTDTNVALMAGQILDPLNSRIY